jgi:hypothetical protein
VPSIRPGLIRIIRYSANCFILAGLALFVINIIGLFNYTTIDGDEIENISDHPRTVSEQEFWANAYKRDGESIKDYVARLTALVDNRMIAVDPQYAKPTFFENWILWFRAQRVGYHEWLDSRRTVRLGGGYCSQHAILLDNLLDEQGIESRILGLGGHVINEVLIDNKWKVYDSNYNVVFDESLNELENHPQHVYEGYLNAGYTESTARNWQEVYGSAENNFHFRNSQSYSSTIYLIFEKLALKLIWYIPAFLLVTGLIARLWLGREESHG